MSKELQCEYPKCNNKGGRDYIRNESDKEGDGWDDEPIFLCDEHAKNHIPYPNYISNQSN